MGPIGIIQNLDHEKISCVILYLSFQVNVLYSQETITINVDPSTTVGTLPPLWRSLRGAFNAWIWRQPNLARATYFLVIDPDLELKWRG
ncbi:MAG: hypothetical protein IPI91_20880 [Flavobacteriales bacterium]|nr:hypothetical protein [Flavobacteriales bacterium]